MAVLMYLSVVMPAFNEAHRIGKTLEEILPYLRAKWERYEVIVSDDGSTDGTEAIVASFTASDPSVRFVTQHKWAGKGEAVRYGMLAAQGDVVLYMDADHATPIKEVERFVPFVSNDRAVFGARINHECSRFRKIVSLTCMILAHVIVFRRAVADAQCGFKLFTREMAARLFSQTKAKGVMIDSEIIHIIHRQELKILFVPVEWEEKPGSRMRVMRSALFDFLELLRIRLRGVVGLYESRA